MVHILALFSTHDSFPMAATARTSCKCWSSFHVCYHAYVQICKDVLMTQPISECTFKKRWLQNNSTNVSDNVDSTQIAEKHPRNNNKISLFSVLKFLNNTCSSFVLLEMVYKFAFFVSCGFAVPKEFWPMLTRFQNLVFFFIDKAI